MPDTDTPTAQAHWRDTIKVHPAADLFPMMSDVELDELGADIKKNGLEIPIAIYLDTTDGTQWLIDGRNRLAAMELAGVAFSLFLPSDSSLFQLETEVNDFPNRLVAHVLSEDPYQYVISANIHRRHLTAEDKRDIIAKLLKANPERSNNATARIIKADDKTVASVRRDLEARSEIPNVDTRTDTRGRKQPAKKPKIGANEACVIINGKKVSHEDAAVALAGETLTTACGRPLHTFPALEPDADEATDESYCAPPEVIEDNALHTIDRSMAVSTAFRKIFKKASASLGPKARARIIEAIDALIGKWKSVQRELRKGLGGKPRVTVMGRGKDDPLTQGDSDALDTLQSCWDDASEEVRQRFAEYNDRADLRATLREIGPKITDQVDNDADLWWVHFTESSCGAMWETGTPAHRKKFLKFMRADDRVREMEAEAAKADETEIDPTDDDPIAASAEAQKRANAEAETLGN